MEEIEQSLIHRLLITSLLVTRMEVREWMESLMACWNTLNLNIHKLAIYIFKCNTDIDLNRNIEIEIDFAL